MNKPSTCNHEDFPCCGCDTEPSQEEQHEAFTEREDENPLDFDEGAFGENAAEELGADSYLDAAYEDRTEIDFDSGE